MNGTFCDHLVIYIRDGHPYLKLLLTDLSQMHLTGLVERTILVFKSSKSDVSLQSKVMAFRVLDFYIGLLEHFKKFKFLRGF